MILQLLRSGRLPPTQQRDSIKSLLHGVEEGISRDQDTIWDLQEEVALLEERVSVLEENKNILASLFAPIRKLPPELIQHIFELSVGGATRISSVCAQWRSIALATPRIWATFIVDFVPIMEGRENYIFRSIERHLQFAGDAELTLDLRAPKSFVVHHEVLEIFAARASHWRSASFKLGEITRAARDILSAALDNTPCLKSLHIRSPARHSDIKLEFFKSCPALRDLSLLEYKTTTSAIPWAQLTSIHFTIRYQGNINTVLDLCPNLISLSLRVPKTYTLGYEGPEITPRTLQIQTLRIESYQIASGSSAFSGLFTTCAGLTLPRLTSLSIVSFIRRRYIAYDETRHEAGYWPRGVVEGMLTRSACKLKTFRSQCIHLDTSEALRLLRLVPHTTQVSLHKCNTTDPESLSERRLDKVMDDLYTNHFITTQLLEALCAKEPTSGSGEALLLPRLRRLHLKVNSKFDMAAYMTMIRSRWPRPGAPRVLDIGVDRFDAISLTLMQVDDYVPWDSKPLLALKRKAFW
ncbi:hypothetical protein B0H19DRAFT_1256077 [Mycena capillaripes]|nr:hypothetical protein B0H19DRAFT_1256077 [Mycena capillaripes]